MSAATTGISMNNQHDGAAGEKGDGNVSQQAPLTQISVLIVDEHIKIARGLAAVLAAMDSSAVTLTSGEPADLIAELHGNAFDVVLVRILPGSRFESSLTQIGVAANAGYRVAAISETTQELVLAAAVDHGAVALLATSAPVTETVEALLNIADGTGLVSSDERDVLNDLYRRHRSNQPLQFLPFSSLSKRESEVLHLLMEGMSVTKIAETSFVSVGTVRTQVKAILRKLGVSSQVAAVALAYRSGWPGVDNEPSAG